MKQIAQCIFMITILFALSGCATGYHKEGTFGGYKDKMISSDTAIIHFSGNGPSTKKQIQQYAMKRAAELTLIHGYHYFQIIKEDDAPKVVNLSYDLASRELGEYTPMTFPQTTLIIKFLSHKNLGSYNADQVFVAVTPG